jgi:hypothetical protein
MRPPPPPPPPRLTTLTWCGGTHAPAQLCGRGVSSWLGWQNLHTYKDTQYDAPIQYLYMMV